MFHFSLVLVHFMLESRSHKKSITVKPRSNGLLFYYLLKPKVKDNRQTADRYHRERFKMRESHAAFFCFVLAKLAGQKVSISLIL